MFKTLTCLKTLKSLSNKISLFFKIIKKYKISIFKILKLTIKIVFFNILKLNIKLVLVFKEA